MSNDNPDPEDTIDDDAGFAPTMALDLDDPLLADANSDAAAADDASSDEAAELGDGKTIPFSQEDAERFLENMEQEQSGSEPGTPPPKKVSRSTVVESQDDVQHVIEAAKAANAARASQPSKTANAARAGGERSRSGAAIAPTVAEQAVPVSDEFRNTGASPAAPIPGSSAPQSPATAPNPTVDSGPATAPNPAAAHPPTQTQNVASAVTSDKQSKGLIIAIFIAAALLLAAIGFVVTVAVL